MAEYGDVGGEQRDAGTSAVAVEEFGCDGIPRAVGANYAAWERIFVGQVAVWRALADQGVYLSTNPASSFFFIFTIAHALHVVGGLGGLLFVQFRNFDRADVSRTTAAAVTSYFWHFLDGLWVFLALLFYLGR